MRNIRRLSVVLGLVIAEGKYPPGSTLLPALLLPDYVNCRIGSF